MTAVTIQSNRIVLSEVRDDEALLEPLHRKKRNRVFDQPSTSQNCASQHLPKTCIVLEFQSADRPYIEQCWKEATRLSWAKLFADPPRAGSCDRHRSWDEGPILEGFPHGRAGEVHGDCWGEPGCSWVFREENKKLPLGESVPGKCFTYTVTFELGLERWTECLFPYQLVVIFPIIEKKKEKKSNTQRQ